MISPPKSSPNQVDENSISCNSNGVDEAFGLKELKSVERWSESEREKRPSETETQPI